jgi:asparagine synthetase B (glutamine-hydrolysing)
MSNSGLSLVGFEGFIRLAVPEHGSGALSPVQEQNGTIWRAPGFHLECPGGCHQAVSATGWVVFSMGEANCAELVGQALDAAFPAGPAFVPPTALGRELAWRLLPSAAVVAVHPATGRASLLRDGAGFRPIYYSLSGNLLRFSSGVRKLREESGVSGINTDKVSEMLLFGHRCGERTIWQGLNTVTPGRMLVFRPDSRPEHWQFWTREHFFDLSERHRLERQPVEKTLEEIQEALDAALMPLGSLGPLVVTSGGGVDSSLLGAYLKRQKRDVQFRCVNKPEAARREEDWMRPLCRKLDIPCEYSHLTRDRFLSGLIEMLVRSGQPLVGPNFVGTYILRKESVASGLMHYVVGEGCDASFGGWSAFHHLSPRFRLLRVLSHLPHRYRLWLTRALADEPSWLFNTTVVVEGAELASNAGGHLERAEALLNALQGTYPGQSQAQRMADIVTWSDFRLDPSYHNHAFFEHEDWGGGRSHFPFVHPKLLRLAIHLPHWLKRRRGQNKWIWRVFASRYLGRDVAFRRKYSFPMPTAAWLSAAPQLIRGGFLEDLLCAKVGDLFEAMAPDNPSRWTLVNVELWGRLHCWKESPERLLSDLVQ